MRSGKTEARQHRLLQVLSPACFSSVRQRTVYVVDKRSLGAAKTGLGVHLILPMPLLEQLPTITPPRPARSRTSSSEPEQNPFGPKTVPLATSPWPARLRRAGLLLLCVLAAVQFVGSYIYLEFPYVDLQQWESGSERLPFQTRLLLAPLYSLYEHSATGITYAENLAHNDYFFPNGVTPGMVLEFSIGIVCVLISGWVAVRLYDGATRRGLLRPLVYPIFLAMCVLLYIVHTVQNFRYVYDLPSLAFFSIGFYLIYFRKPLPWFVLLFTVATLNRETTLLLLPFWALSQALGADGRVRWRGLLQPRVLGVLGALGVYWVLWHHIVFSMFGANPSEYYPRAGFNFHCFLRLRYWPQLASAFAFLWPFLIVYRKQVRDAQLRAWMMVLPLWYAFMFMWAVLTETRVFGELIPFLAPVAALMAEEVFARKLLGDRGVAQEEVVPVPFRMGGRAA